MITQSTFTEYRLAGVKRSVLCLLDCKEIQPVHPKGDQSWVFIGSSLDWCWSWNSNTLATWCEELTHWKRPWCWERLKAGGEGDDRGWDGWMASLTRWTWVWVDSVCWWWTGRPSVLQFTGSQRVRHNWATGLNWYLLHINYTQFFCFLDFESHTTPWVKHCPGLRNMFLQEKLKSKQKVIKWV